MACALALLYALEGHTEGVRQYKGVFKIGQDGTRYTYGGGRGFPFRPIEEDMSGTVTIGLPGGGFGRVTQQTARKLTRV